VNIKGDIKYGEVLHSTQVTKVYRGSYKDKLPVIVKCTAQDVPDEHIIEQYKTSFLAQKKIDHPAVNGVIEYIVDGAGCALLLEDIGGETLKSWINSTLEENIKWPLEVPELFHLYLLRLLRWSIILAEGISAFHQKNVIHNDISPDNIIVNPSNDQLQIIDFGAAFPDDSNIGDCESVERSGLLTYISPEQTGRLNRNIDYRSDYYAFGATLYQLFSGRPPFMEKDLPGLIHCHIARNPEAIDVVNPLLPASLSALITKLMAKAPEDRYQNGRCLIQDLKAIELAVKTGIPLLPSALGENDVPEKLLIPAKLYGRKNELRILQKVLCDQNDKPSLVVVEGEAGGGKTSLVNEVVTHFVDRPLLLLSGKNEIYNNRPHLALSKALAKSVGFLLDLPDKMFFSWRNSLLKELNGNPHTLIGLCPDIFELFEGLAIPSESVLYNADIQLKLHVAIYLRHLSKLDHILLIIEDSHWSDSPSFLLLETLIKANNPRMTVLFTCRSEEVDGLHPYSKFKKSVEVSNRHLTTISLKNLNIIQISDLLHSTFHNPIREYEDIAVIIFKKTLGNPFFIHEFLKVAHKRSDKTLFYDHVGGRWCWSVIKLNQISTSGNVASLLIDSLDQQSNETQRILQWAACIGSEFNENILSLVAKSSEWNIKKHLNLVCVQGYIRKLPGLKNNYVFNHDRIRQAYYEFQSAEMVVDRHWGIGEVYLASRGGDPLPHLFRALSSGFFPNNIVLGDLRDLINVFFEGSLSAKENLAYDISLKYVGCTLNLLDKYKILIKENVCGDEFYNNMIGSALQAQGALAYLVDDRKLAEKAFVNYRKINTDKVIQAASYAKQAPLVFVLGDFDTAVLYSLKCLELLGVDVPAFGCDISLKVDEQWDIFRDGDGFLRVFDIVEFEIVDSIALSTIQSISANMLLMFANKRKFEWAEWFGLVGINSFLKSGGTPFFAQLIGLFDCVLYSCGRERFSRGMADKACELVESYSVFSGSGFVYSSKGAYSGRYNQSMFECIDLLDKGAKCSLATGEYLGYVACISNKIVVSFSAGVSLVVLHNYADELERFLVSCGELVSVGKYYYRLLDQLLDPEAPDYLNEKCFSKIQWEALTSSVAYGAYFHLKLQRDFWRIEYQAVVTEYQLDKPLLETVRGFSIGDDNHFLYAISHFQNASVDDPLGINEAFILASESVQYINTVAMTYPPNFRHKALLIEAEQQRLKGDHKATATYQLAAIDAKENGFIQMYALTHELHASYWQQQGRPDYVKYHIEKALQGYHRWGCSLKIEQLQRRFGQFLLQQTSSEFQDQRKLLKVSNEITEELDLNQRLRHIIELVVKHSGAEQGTLLLKQNNQYITHSVAYLNGKEVLVYAVAMDQLPMELINGCALSKQSLLIGDAVNDPNFQGSVMSQTKKVSSLLCYPVEHKGVCQSLLLLTHSQPDVFTEQHRQLLQSLAPQIAVSIENAQLYQEHQEFKVALEQKITQRTSELKGANEELQAFTASVSHDLRAPLRAIIGFTGALSEDFSQCLGEKGRQDATHLVDESQSMRVVIDGLIVLSRSTQIGLRREEVNLSTLVEDKLRWLRTMEVEHEVVDKVQQGLTASGDLRLLKQIVDNLIANAWKFSHGVEEPAISFGMVATSNSQHTFYVQDNGVGFDADNAEELFSPFRRFHKDDAFEGSGIGLATVYRIIKRHGGEIWVESEVNQGAIFYFTLNTSAT